MFAVIIMGGCPFVFDRNILVFEISFQQNDRLTKFHLLCKKKRLLVVDDGLCLKEDLDFESTNPRI